MLAMARPRRIDPRAAAQTITGARPLFLIEASAGAALANRSAGGERVMRYYARRCRRSPVADADAATAAVVGLPGIGRSR